MPGPADRRGQGHGDRTRGRRHAPACHTRCFPKGMMHQRAMSSEYNGGAWDTGAANTRASSTLEARPHSWRTHGALATMSRRHRGSLEQDTLALCSMKHQQQAGACSSQPSFEARVSGVRSATTHQQAVTWSTAAAGTRDCMLPPAPVLRDRPEEATAGLVCTPTHV